jgi:hypothetical protein
MANRPRFVRASLDFLVLLKEVVLRQGKICEQIMLFMIMAHLAANNGA